MSSALSTMKIGIWGFYNQGNLGDDLMAIMFYDLIREAGFAPTIISTSDRFRSLGYASVPTIGATTLDAVVIGGGAFFKAPSSSKNDLSRSVEALLGAMDVSNMPVVAMSIGSDGVSALSELAPARRQVLEHPKFKGAFVRLRRDLSLGIRNTNFLPDIVLSTSYYFRKYKKAYAENNRVGGKRLYNFSRRSMPYIPVELWRGRGVSKAIFLSQSTSFENRSEVKIPFIDVIDSDNIYNGISALASSQSITSSKLHPGLAAISFGGTFRALAARDKTRAVISEYEKEGLFSVNNESRHLSNVRLLSGQIWQQALWGDYRHALIKMLSEAKSS